MLCKVQFYLFINKLVMVMMVNLVLQTIVHKFPYLSPPEAFFPLSICQSQCILYTYVDGTNCMVCVSDHSDSSPEIIKNVLESTSAG